MSNKVHVHQSVSNLDIAHWCNECNITYTRLPVTCNAITFEPIYAWVIEDEKERTMFILKWGK